MKAFIWVKNHLNILRYRQTCGVLNQSAFQRYWKSLYFLIDLTKVFLNLWENERIVHSFNILYNLTKEAWACHRFRIACLSKYLKIIFDFLPFLKHQRPRRLNERFVLLILNVLLIPNKPFMLAKTVTYQVQNWRVITNY